MYQPSITHHGSVNFQKFQRADPTTIQRKFIVGYQGWFTCKGDGADLDGHDWNHWMKDSEEEQTSLRPATDLWPEMSRYPPSEQYPVPGLRLQSGNQAFLFSSSNPRTVQRHFNWMACHGIDGVFFQRSVRECDPMNPDYKTMLGWRDRVGDNVRLAAEAEGRVFSIMYDVSGIDSGRIQQVLEHDWIHLIREKCMLDSPNYLHERGKPVLCLWGFGFTKTQHDPEMIRTIVTFFRQFTPGGAYIIAGIPSHWRTGDGGSRPEPALFHLWLSLFDAILPWTVRCYDNEEGATTYADEIMRADIELLNAQNSKQQGPLGHVDYIPVVFPGSSNCNGSGEKWAFNNVRREGGCFLWRQIYNALDNGATIIYGATWDEYDEGTALMPAVERKHLLPDSPHFPLLSLDEDGYDIPSDWYMRICGLGARSLRGEINLQPQFPLEILQNYNDNGTSTNRLATTRSGSHELPPPPYSQHSSIIPFSQSVRRTSRPRPLPPLPAGPGALESTTSSPKGPFHPPSITITTDFTKDRTGFTHATSKRSDVILAPSPTLFQDDDSSTRGSPTLLTPQSPHHRDSSTEEARQSDSIDIASPVSSDASPISPSISPTRRFSLFFSRNKESRSSVFRKLCHSPLEDKSTAAEIKRQKKEESRARTEKLAEQLKAKAKERAASVEPDRISSSSSSTGRRIREPGSMYGGIAGVTL
ncbi:hypothetical protein FB446DRAFT_61874 [Lentinula raphanica]|nr:hypothetical protein FB446DRAFT_61874 [Lentinula raphanica]